MSQEELVRRLKNILCWVPSESIAASKLKELILQLGGRV